MTRGEHITRAIELLKQARAILRVEAGAPRAAEAVQRAINSAEGAARHARGDLYRLEDAHERRARRAAAAESGESGV